MQLLIALRTCAVVIKQIRLVLHASIRALNPNVMTTLGDTKLRKMTGKFEEHRFFISSRNSLQG